MNDGVYVDVHQVRPDPATPGRLLAVTGAGLYISEDQAATWQEGPGRPRARGTRSVSRSTRTGQERR